MSVNWKNKICLLAIMVCFVVASGCQTTDDAEATRSSAVSADQTPPRYSHAFPGQRDWIAPPRVDASGRLPYQDGVVVVRWKDELSKASVDGGIAAELGLVRGRPRRGAPRVLSRSRCGIRGS